MVHVAHGHFREVWVDIASVPGGSDAPGPRREKKWVCRHCELIQGVVPKHYALGTSPTSRMVHIKEKHDSAPPPPRVRLAASSSSVPDESEDVEVLISPSPSTSILPPSAKRRKTNDQPTLHTSFTSVNNSDLMPAMAALFARAGIAHHVIEYPEFIAAVNAIRRSNIPVGDRRALKQHQGLLAQMLRQSSQISLSFSSSHHWHRWVDQCEEG